MIPSLLPFHSFPQLIQFSLGILGVSMGMLGWVVAAVALLLVGVTSGQQQQQQGDYSYDYNYVDTYDIPAGDSSGRSKTDQSAKKSICKSARKT